MDMCELQHTEMVSHLLVFIIELLILIHYWSPQKAPPKLQLDLLNFCHSMKEKKFLER